MFDPKIHWFWLINGLVVVIFLVLSQSLAFYSVKLSLMAFDVESSGRKHSREECVEGYCEV